MSSAWFAASNTSAARGRTTGGLSADSSPDRFMVALFGDAAASWRVRQGSVADAIEPAGQGHPAQSARRVHAVQQPAGVVDGGGDAVADVFLDQGRDADGAETSAACVTAGPGDPDAALLVEGDLSVRLPDCQGDPGDARSVLPALGLGPGTGHTEPAAPSRYATPGHPGSPGGAATGPGRRPPLRAAAGCPQRSWAGSAAARPRAPPGPARSPGRPAG